MKTTFASYSVLCALGLLFACGGNSNPDPLAGAKLVFTQAPATTYQGETLAPVRVEVQDAQGAVRTAATGSVTLSLSGGTLAGTTSATLSGGKATFSSLHIDAAQTGAKLTAHLSGLADVSSSAFDLKPVQVKLSGLPASLVSGDTFSVTATLVDPQTGSTLPFARAVTLSASGLSLAGSLTQTSSAGVAIFSGLSFDAGGTATLSASAPAASGDQTASFDVTQLVLEFKNLAATALPGVIPDFQVRLVDPSGNVLANTQRQITLSASGASVTGSTTVDSLDGVATFGGLGIAQPATVSFTASAAGAAPVTSASLVTLYSTQEVELANKSNQTNDTQATAEPIDVGIPVFGSLATAGDVDFYRFHALQGQLLDVISYAGRMDQASWSAGPELAIYAADGSRLWFNSSFASGWSDVDYGFAKVQIPADGDYFVSIAVRGGGVGGKYGLRVALEDPIPNLQLEAELPSVRGSNDGTATAEPIVPGWLLGSQFYDTATDLDFYGISIAQPTRLHAEIIGGRNGFYLAQTSSYDADIQLVDGSGVLRFDDDDAHWYDSALDYVIATPGDFFIDVGRTNGTCTLPYFLHYWTEPVSFTPEVLPNDSAATATPIAYGDIVSGTSTGTEDHFFSFTGKAGDMVRVRPFDSRTMDTATAKISVSLLQADGTTALYQSPELKNFFLHQTILLADGDYRVKINGAAAGSWAFALERFAANAYEVEPNSAPITQGGTIEANPFPADGRIAGAINPIGDEDNYSFQASAGQLVSIDVVGDSGSNNADYSFSRWGSLILPTLQIVDGSGNVLASTTIGNTSMKTDAESFDRPLAMEGIAFQAPADGTYYLVVTEEPGLGGPNSMYALQLFYNQ